jgi:hypothetical protein
MKHGIAEKSSKSARQEVTTSGEWTKVSMYFARVARTTHIPAAMSI